MPATSLAGFRLGLVGFRLDSGPHTLPLSLELSLIAVHFSCFHRIPAILRLAWGPQCLRRTVALHDFSKLLNWVSDFVGCIRCYAYRLYVKKKTTLTCLKEKFLTCIQYLKVGIVDFFT